MRANASAPLPYFKQEIKIPDPVISYLTDLHVIRPTHTMDHEKQVLLNVKKGLLRLRSALGANGVLIGNNEIAAVMLACIEFLQAHDPTGELTAEIDHG